jgi:uncharacterized BrkB/YihY/UPF0761 family membrane protein
MVIQGSKKGQTTLVNLLGLLVVLFMLFVFLPIIGTMSDTTVAAMSITPNDYTPYYIALIRIIPLALIVSVILTGIYYAVPRREGI